ncbi:MAG: hypothetical protein U9Q80_01905 [Bacillota bacterium]|nr:hypothetical protein [Bacillota bacterium]
MDKKKIIIVMWIVMFISIFISCVNNKLGEMVEEDTLVFSSLDEFESNLEVVIEEEEKEKKKEKEKEIFLPQIEVIEIAEQQTEQQMEQQTDVDVDVVKCVEVNDEDEIQHNEVMDDEIQQKEVKIENETAIDEYDFIVEKYDVKFSKLQSIANDELDNLIEVFKEEYQNLSSKEKESLSTRTLIAAMYVNYAKELESRIDDFFYFMIDGFEDELSVYGYDTAAVYEYIDVYENEKERRKKEILEKALN